MLGKSAIHSRKERSCSDISEDRQQHIPNGNATPGNSVVQNKSESSRCQKPPTTDDAADPRKEVWDRDAQAEEQKESETQVCDECGYNFGPEIRQKRSYSDDNERANRPVLRWPEFAIYELGCDIRYPTYMWILQKEACFVQTVTSDHNQCW